MAKSNIPVEFSMDEEELMQRIEAYKAGVESGEILRASWPHFCAYLGYTETEVKAEIKRGGLDPRNANTHTRRALELKRMLTWIRGEMLSGKGWSGQNQTKAIFALKQDNGDGFSYTDQPTASGPQEVRVVFGGADPRAKRAQK